MIGKLKQLLALQRGDNDFLASFSQENFGDSRTFAKEIYLMEEVEKYKRNRTKPFSGGEGWRLHYGVINIKLHN